MPESLSKTVARNTIFSALGYFASVLVLLFLIPYIIGKLGPELYGIWVIIAIVTGYVGLSDLGIGTSFQKFIAEYYAQNDADSINKVVNSGFVFFSFLGLLLVGIAIIFVDPLITFLDFPLGRVEESKFVFLIAIGNLALGNPLSVFPSVMNGMQLIDLVRKIELGIMVTRVMVYVITLEYGLGIKGLILSESFLLLLSAAINYSFVKRVFPQMRLQPWRLDVNIFRKLFNYGGKLQVSRLSELVNFQLDRIIISKFVGLQYVVFTDVGGKLLSRMRVLPLILLSSLVPAVSQLQALNQTERIRLAFERSTKYLTVIAIPLFVFVAVFAHPIMRLWFDPSFSMAAYTMQILALGYLFNVLTGSISFVSQGIGNVTIQMWVAIIQTVVNIVLSILLVIQVGYYGVMIGTTVALIAGAVWYTFAFDRLLQGSLSSIIRMLTLPVIAATLGILCAMMIWFLSDVTESGRGLELVLLPMCGIVYSVIYFIVLRVKGYFDEWDAEFLMRISPKLGVLKKILFPKRALSA